MKSKIKMVVFDMAGTTVNEDNVVYKTLRKAINEAGVDVDLDQVLAEGAGMEKKQAIRSVLKSYANMEDEALTEQIYANFITDLAAAYSTADIQPQNGALALFSALKERGILTVLNTGYDGVTARSIIKKIRWHEGVDFDALVTDSDVSRNRPNPDMIYLAMNKFGISDSTAVVKVGDSAIDIGEGKNAGCGLTIGITTGAHTMEQLLVAKPDHIINQLMDLLPIIDNFNS
ncbi:phosphonatase-like hydrolase [Mucilaginibacter gossypiicola]|uniref:Phosphonatase-like hydrolase n=1 Tax=Mucilaginibacter gossypiicola TaxID=551995 RepID=A0A1H8NRX1_9SPHI|nr:phosphonatase-like hydrolase [Mucilaginibacter gossypiicola]SEO32078.1 phosphonatase-like hydrolase [Mucilaginibacter gossypiicola]